MLTEKNCFGLLSFKVDKFTLVLLLGAPWALKSWEPKLKCFGPLNTLDGHNPFQAETFTLLLLSLTSMQPGTSNQSC